MSTPPKNLTPAAEALRKAVEEMQNALDQVDGLTNEELEKRLVDVQTDGLALARRLAVSTREVARLYNRGALPPQ